MKIFSTIKSVALKQVLTIVLAGVLLVVNTACSRVVAMDAPNSPNPPGQVQPYEGGMNNFRDVDTSRLDTSKVDARAKSLRDRVEKNIDEKRIDSVDQYVDNYRSGTPLGERTERFANDVRRGVDSFAGDTKEATDRLSDKAGRAAENAKDNTKAASRDAVRDTKQAADNVKDTAKSAYEKTTGDKL